MGLSPVNAGRNLELTETLRGTRKAWHSAVGAGQDQNRHGQAPAAQAWMEQPLLIPAKLINRRLNAVEEPCAAEPSAAAAT